MKNECVTNIRRGAMDALTDALKKDEAIRKSEEKRIPEHAVFAAGMYIQLAAGTFKDGATLLRTQAEAIAGQLLNLACRQSKKDLLATWCGEPRLDPRDILLLSTCVNSCS